MVHHRPVELPTVRRVQRVRPRRGRHRKPVFSVESGPSAPAWPGRSKTRPVSGVWSRDAHSTALFLHVGCSLAGLCLVRHFKVILPCPHTKR